MAKVYARNLNTGQVTKVPEHYLTHPVFGKSFAPADKHDKDYVPELYKPKTSGEAKSARTNKKNEEPKVVTEPINVSVEDGDANG